jgi:hypothetical protein
VLYRDHKDLIVPKADEGVHLGKFDVRGFHTS